jgi:hypothetical protein
MADCRYWDQAAKELGKDQWHLVPAGDKDAPKDWIEWLVVSLHDLSPSVFFCFCFDLLFFCSRMFTSVLG